MLTLAQEGKTESQKKKNPDIYVSVKLSAIQGFDRTNLLIHTG